MALAENLRTHLLRNDGGELAVASEQHAYRICRRIAFGHYENFPVASLVLGRLRDDVAAIYAYARLGDDIADDLPAEPHQKYALLDMLESWLEQPPREHPIACAVACTIKRHALPDEPFRRLLAAFRYDVEHIPFADEAALGVYCQNSAAPIGELLLRLLGEWNEHTAPYSDAFCAGLQVLNFWQDLWSDTQRNRWTIPLEWLPAGIQLEGQVLLTDAELCRRVIDNFDRLVGELLPSGRVLRQQLRNMRLRLQVGASWESALIIWQACRARGIQITTCPRLRWRDIPRIVLGTMLA